MMLSLEYGWKIRHLLGTTTNLRRLITITAKDKQTKKDFLFDLWNMETALLAEIEEEYLLLGLKLNHRKSDINFVNWLAKGPSYE